MTALRITQPDHARFRFAGYQRRDVTVQDPPCQLWARLSLLSCPGPDAQRSR